MTPFPLDGGRAGDGGAGTRSAGFQGDVSQTDTYPAARTPSPGLSPIEGERRPALHGEGRRARIAALRQIARERILVLDGAWGVMFQREGLEEADFRGERFADHPSPLKGDNDLLCLTRPDLVTKLHDAYFAAGADICETNSFNATSISQSDYGLEPTVRDINLAAARLGRESADRFTADDPSKPRFLAGAIGPLSRTLSISPDVNDPGARAVTFAEVHAAYLEQARALHEGGVDLFLIETVFDTLNAKAAIKAVMDLEDEGLEPLPIWISGTITDRSGRTLSGQTVEAFWNSVRHAKPFAVGLNCALGAELMRPHLAELGRVADTLVSAYPNAGLPNAFGEYDEQPHETGGFLEEWARSGLVNIVGGCCGTTPEHIGCIAQGVEGLAPRAIPQRPPAMRLSGLEAFEVALMRWWSLLFWVAAAFNAVIGLALLLAPTLAPGTPPSAAGAALLPARMLGWCILVFGLSYAFVAVSPERNRDIVRLGVVGKAGVFAIVVATALASGLPFATVAGGAADLAFVTLFLVFLTRAKGAP